MCASDKNLPRRSMLLTFDDGLREIKDVVAPILMRRGIPAVFFVTTGFIDNRGMQHSFKASLIIDPVKRDRSGQIRRAAERFFARDGSSHPEVEQGVLSLKYNDTPLLDEFASQIGIDFNAYLREQRPFLTKDEVVSLKREGFEIGAHTVDHPKFAHIPLDQQMTQTLESLEYVEREFKSTLRLFAFPFSDRGVSRAFFGVIRKVCVWSLARAAGGSLARRLLHRPAQGFGPSSLASLGSFLRGFPQRGAVGTE
jgi:peptidoglycan/xylan/chitin deacetylase (PgdA/CDA1 family)